MTNRLLTNTPCGLDSCDRCTPESMALFTVVEEELHAGELIETFGDCFGRSEMEVALREAIAEGYLAKRSDGKLSVTPHGHRPPSLAGSSMRR